MQNARLFLAHYEYINNPHITYYKHLLKGSCYKEKAMLLLYSIPPSVVSLERHFIFQLNINSYRYSRSSLSWGICSRIDHSSSTSFSRLLFTLQAQIYMVSLRETFLDQIKYKVCLSPVLNSGKS